MSLRFVFCVNARVFRRKTRAEKENVRGTRWKRARREERRRGGDVSVDARVESRARSVGCHRRLDRARVADPFRVRERGAPGDSPRSTDSRPLFRFWRANGRHIAARWGRRRDRRRRTAGSPEDASGKAPRAFDEKRRTGAHLGSGRRVRGCGARTARAREHVPSEEATDRGTILIENTQKITRTPCKLAIAGSLARGFGPLRVTSGAARQGDTGVPRRGIAYAKHFAWPPPARARRETHRGSSRLADG